jgi:hypothetical protein
MKTKSIITTGIMVVSLVLGGNVAMAANVHAPAKAAHARPVTHVAGRTRYPRSQVNGGVAQLIQGFFGGVLPPQYLGMVQSAERRGATGSYAGSADFSPTYDTSTPVDNTGPATAQAAADEDAAIQQMNDTNAMTASMAAAEQENDAANAATLQTEINAGM